ncbi:MAG: hypothetical protein FWF67_07920 [Fibromonadales bacterium]|nr:hypothetical protein [Fibromonadales bacterium]
MKKKLAPILLFAVSAAYSQIVLLTPPPEPEINFSQILSKDTTVEGYEARIHRLTNATGVDKNVVNSAIAVLNDHIIATQSTVLAEIATTAKVELGAYNLEEETCEFEVQDTADTRSPFYFYGKVNIPIDSARNMDRNTVNFTTTLYFLNFPFKTDSGNVNLAMYGLRLSLNGQDLKLSGSFYEIVRYRHINGYPAWRLRADSLLRGELRASGLDYAHFTAATAVKDIAKSESEIANTNISTNIISTDIKENKEASSGGLGWRGITRIVAFSATAILGAAAIYKHLEVDKSYKELEDLKAQVANTDEWKNSYNAKADETREKEQQRNILGAAAGVFAVSGAITFFF